MHAHGARTHAVRLPRPLHLSHAALWQAGWPCLPSVLLAGRDGGGVVLTCSWVCCAQQDNAYTTEETCTQYNNLKIARALFQWTGSSAFADYYELALLNGIIGGGHAAAGLAVHVCTTRSGASPAHCRRQTKHACAAGG